MQHVAIMKKSWGLIPKILSGEKTIESRWYKTKRTPWNKIKPGDIVYFKNAGEPVTIQTEVKKVIYFSDLNKTKVRKILQTYGNIDGINRSEIKKFFDLFKDKRYCMLIYIKHIKKIQPFNIDKSGHGMMSAWITDKKIKRF